MMNQSGADLTVPAVHALHLADVAKEYGVEPGDLFAEVGASAASLAVPGAELPVPTLVQLVCRARALTREPALGLHVGLRMSVSAHGYLGFAAMSAATVADALDVALRFLPTRTNALRLSKHVSGGLASLVVEERADFGEARDAILVAVLVGIWRIGCSLTRRELDGCADFAFPMPPYFESLAPTAARVRFDQPVNQLVFDASILDLPLPTADPVSRQLAAEQCERSLDALKEDGVLAHVRRLVFKGEAGVRSLEEIATEVHLSSRTLKRKLASHGVTYTDVVDEQRREAALLLLRSPSLSLDAVAEQLGYSDVANFSRAFRRWTGVSPGAYRRG